MESLELSKSSSTNSKQIINPLENKDKNFEFVLYPGGRHGWGGAKGNHFANLNSKFIYKY